MPKRGEYLYDVFKNVNKLYNKEFRAVENMNLQIKECELFPLIGPSGLGGIHYDENDQPFNRTNFRYRSDQP